MLDNELNIYTDGGARGNPGPAAIGVVIKNLRGEKIIAFGKKIGEATNNIAEFKAVIEALKYLNLQSKQKLKLHFFLDSLLVTKQLAGEYKIKNMQLKELFYQATLLRQKISILTTFTNIPREQNQEADREVNLALGPKY